MNQGDEEKASSHSGVVVPKDIQLDADLPGLDGYARMIVKRISDAAIELAFVRHSLTSDEVDVDDDADVKTRVAAVEQFCEEVKEDTFACLTGDDSGCLDPEELDESNCELIWLKTQLTKSAEGGHNPELSQDSPASLPVVVSESEITRYEKK